MSKYGFDSDGAHSERSTDRIYRENPELLGFGNGENESEFHPSRSGSGGKGSGGAGGGCGCAVFLVILGIAVLFMESDAAFFIYVIFALIVVFAYSAKEK